MGLADEIDALITEKLKEQPAARAFLEGDQNAAERFDVGIEDMLIAIHLGMAGHRAALTRLADEIDALKRGQDASR